MELSHFITTLVNKGSSLSHYHLIPSIYENLEYNFSTTDWAALHIQVVCEFLSLYNKNVIMLCETVVI
jgi:hypothetical protein